MNADKTRYGVDTDGSPDIWGDRIDDQIVQRGAVIERTDFETAIRRNKQKATALCCVLIVIGGFLGYAVGWSMEVILADQGLIEFRRHAGPVDHILVSLWGIGGCVAMLTASAVWGLIVMAWGDRVLIWMVDGQDVSEDEERRLHNVVAEMSIAAGLPKPRVVVVEDQAFNAFAAGLNPEHATIGVTRGLLQSLDRDELQGVVGHEVGHILNNDVLYATMVGVMVGLIVMVADTIRAFLRGARYSSSGNRKKGGAVALAMLVLILVSIVAPISARLVQMAISRKREFLADATSVKLTRNPTGLAGALKKISGTDERFTNANRSIQHMFIANPFRDFDANASALMSTHPPLADRIRRLRGMM